MHSLLWATLLAAVDPTAADAIAMAEKAAAYGRAHGQQALLEKIAAKDPDFIQGSLYVDARDIHSGVVLAHPVNPQLVGKDLVNVPDASGKLYRKEILAVAKDKGKGWVDYHYKNPVSGKVEPKTTYILRLGDIVLEAGIYKK
ncbi:cache domain-containing protein [Massilia sp. TS11]|uniref:cache domain-containing protein n=1 Tax=Massilia sp. TS11 TaxID=2908003 RepID=UPI001EDB733C|nr:cache domain-containing protein [Massilia sp. TS11]MCG2586267.1 cache domain-containing protein [Massilia sp. TS11]